MKRLNFRPVLFGAMGLTFGIFLTFSIYFGRVRASDFLLVALFCFFLFRRPFAWKNIALILSAFVAFALVGGLSAHLYTETFFSGRGEGEYTVEGTVTSFTAKRGYSTVELDRLAFDGARVDGKLTATVTDESVRVGDILRFTKKVSRLTKEDVFQTADGLYAFIGSVRYTAGSVEAERVGKSANVFLTLNGALYDCLRANLLPDEASVAYALLTGSGGNMDATLSDAVRKGGVAHIFAVSGLHIGILYTAAFLLCAPLKRWRFLPATLICFGYCALCSFTVSSLRALIMCAVGGLLKAWGGKRDFLECISVAAILLLMLFPAEWLSVGFRLSFGACMGLALFSGTFTRLFKRLRFPKILGDYLGASLGVQLFTFPVLMESFGYLSLWGTLLNFFVIPALPALFLGLIVCVLFALVIPPAAAFFLAIPAGLLALLNFVFSLFDFTAVLRGFSLGAGAVVWLIACVFLSERFRLSAKLRAIAASGFAVLFVVCVMVENCVFYGVEIVGYRQREGNCLLVRTRGESVLVLDGEIRLSDCEEFLSRRYGGMLTAIVVLDEYERGLNTAAFLPCERVYAMREVDTGLRQTQVVFAQSFQVGAMRFTYETPTRLTAIFEGVSVEISFEEERTTGSDLFLGRDSASARYRIAGNVVYTK